MQRNVFAALSISYLFFLHGCITPNVVTNNFVYAEDVRFNNLHMTIMPLLADELSNAENNEASKEIIEKLSSYKNIKQIILPVESEENLFDGKELSAYERIVYYKNNRIVNKLISEELLNKWDSCWKNYLNKKVTDKDVLKKLGDMLDVNAVLQFALTDLIRIRPIHRKVVAETTVIIKYVMFSIDGSVLLEGKSIAKQSNAWSGQLTPKPVEVFNIALNDIFENLGFYQNY